MSPATEMASDLRRQFIECSTEVCTIRLYGRIFEVRLLDGTHTILQCTYEAVRDKDKTLLGWHGEGHAIRVARPTVKSDACRIARYLVARKAYNRAVSDDARMARAVFGFGFPRLGARSGFPGPDPVVGTEPSDEEAKASVARVAETNKRWRDAQRALGKPRHCTNPESWFRASFSTLAALRESCRRLEEQDFTLCDVTVVVDPAGKPRGITRHDADLVRASRGMTACLLAGLRTVRQCRPMLESERVDLQWRGDQDVVAYSADLSAATDHIGNELAETALATALNALDAPRWLKNVTRHVTSRVRVTKMNQVTGEVEEFPVRCGALMGLGPGWTTLSLLNRYAALKAGAQHGSFSICGDDLVAVWPRSTCDRYEKNLETLGLVVNKTKSFRGTGAVFCEQFGVLTRKLGRWRLKMQERVCLSEAHAVTTRVAGVSIERGLASVDRLRDVSEGARLASRPVRALARRVANSLAFHSNHLVKGRLDQGGSGKGTANAQTVRAFALFGSAPTSPPKVGARARRIAENTRALLLACGTKPAGKTSQTPTLSEALSSLSARVVLAEDLSHTREAHLNLGRTPAQFAALQSKDNGRLRAAHRRRAKESKRMTCKQAINSEASRARFTAQARRKASHLVAKRAYTAAISALAKGERRVADQAPGEQIAPFLPESNFVVSRRQGLSNPKGATRP